MQEIEPGARQINFPFPAPEWINSLREIVEVAPGEVGALVAELLREVQVISARLRDLEAQLNGGRDRGMFMRANVEDYAIQIARAHAFTGILFDYARGEIDSVSTEEPSEQAIVSSLHQACNIYKVQHEELYTKMRRRRDRRAGKQAGA